MPGKKVIFVESDDARRKLFSDVMGVIGYDVHAYESGESAFAEISQNGEVTFVLLVPYDMGNGCRAVEARMRLGEHSRRTGVEYGMVCTNVPWDARSALKKEHVPHTMRDFDLIPVSDKIDAEFERLEANGKPKASA